MTSETEILASFDKIVAEQNNAVVVETQNRKIDEIPVGFELRRDGVYRSIFRGKEWEWVKVCSSLKVVALIRDGAGSEWGRLLEWTDLDGRLHQWAMPVRLLAGDGTEYREHLLDDGLVIEPGRQARDGLHSYIAVCKPAARATAVSRLGWHDKLFVLPDAVFGAPPNGERVILQTSQPTEHILRQQGTLEGWKKEVGARCKGNSRLIHTVSCAFAAPLIYLVGEESGGFNLVGPSSIGKTTLILAGGSVCGGGGIAGYRRQWRATANALESVAATHCDILLPLDEISQVSGREAGEAAYLLANGSGKARARRDGSGRPTVKWRSFFISTGEITLADRVAEDGRRRATAGQGVRVIDIPADAGAGLGCFENLHGEKDGDAFARKLRDTTEREYGTPLRAYLKEIAQEQDPTEIAEWVRKVRGEFVKEVQITLADGQVQRVLGRFALVAAAGELATKLNITGWKEGDAIAAVAKCFAAWLDRRGSTGPAEIAAGISQIRRFFEQHGQSRFADFYGADGERPIANRCGFKRQEDGKTEYYVHLESFRSELCAGLDVYAIARECIRLGLLIPASDGKPQRPERIPALLGETENKRVYHFTSAIIGDLANEQAATAAA